MLATGPGSAEAHDPVGSIADMACGISGGIDDLGGTVCPLRATEIVYVTNFGVEGQAPLRRQMTSAVNVPTPLNVDNRVGADLIATVKAIGAGKVTLEVNKATGAAATLPVSIVAHANDPADVDLRYVFGYDARRSTAPGKFSETFLPRAGGLGVSVNSSGTPSLALLGKRIRVTPVTRQVNGVEAARVRFSPLPTTLSGDLAVTEANGVKETEATVKVGSASKVEVDFADNRSLQKHTDLAATLDRLGQRATIGLTQTPVPGAIQPGSLRTELELTTLGARIGKASAVLAETVGGALKSKTRAALGDLPRSPNLSTPAATLLLVPQTATAPETIILNAVEPFGLVDIARANGEPRTLTDDRYAYVFDDGMLSSAAARIRGLKTANLKLSDELVDVSAQAAPGPFHVLVEEPGKRVDADIRDLPGKVDFILKPNGTPTIHYTGSSRIGQATVNVHDDAGLAESTPTGQLAKDLKAILTDLPTELTVDLAPGGKEIMLTAENAATGNPDEIGKLEVQLWTRPPGTTGDQLPDSADQQFVNGLGTAKDGALVRDTFDRYVIFARINSLESATLELEREPTHIDLEHGASYLTRRPFRVLLEEEREKPIQLGTAKFKKSVDALVENLPADIDLKLRETGTPTIKYLGSQTIGRVTARVHDDAAVACSQKTGRCAKDLKLIIDNLPTDVTVAFNPSRIDADAKDSAGNPAEIGKVEAQLWTRAPSATDDKLPNSSDQQFVDALASAGKDGALLRDHSDRYVIYALVTSLKSLSLELEGQTRFAVDLTHKARPFRALVTEDGKSIDVDISQLPASVFFALAPKATDSTIIYDGSDQIGLITARLHDDNGIATSERTGLKANDLRLEIQNLPAGVVRALLDPSGKNIKLNSTQPIGSVEVQLWTRPPNASDDTLPDAADKQFVTNLGTTKDGALVRDVTGRYVIFARISQLKSLDLLLPTDPQDPAAVQPDVKLVTDSRRNLELSVANKSTSGGPDEQIDASVTNRPKCMRFSLSKQRRNPSSCSSGLPGSINLPSPAAAAATTILYEGSETTGRIDVVAKGLKDLQGQELSVRMDGVTPRLEAIVQGQDQVDMGTLGGDGDVDLLELRLRKGTINPNDVISSQFDGVLIRDKLQSNGTFDRAVLFARLSRLRSLHFARGVVGRLVDLKLDSVGGRTFDLDMERDTAKSTPGGIEIDREKTQAAVDPLRPNTTFTLDNSVGGELKAHYDAASAANILTFDRKTFDNQGFKTASTEIEATPLPSRVDFCFRDKGTACGLDAFTGHSITKPVPACPSPPPTGPANDPWTTCVLENGPHPTGPTVIVDGAQQMDVTFHQCLISFCENPNRPRLEVEASAKLFKLQLSRIVLRIPVFNQGQPPPLIIGHVDDERTLVFLDTDNNPVGGLGAGNAACGAPCAIFLKLPSGGQLDTLQGTLPDSAPMFQAQDRRVRIDQVVVPQQDAASGSIFCPSGMKVGANGGIFGIGGADLTGVLCNNPNP